MHYFSRLILSDDSHTLELIKRNTALKGGRKHHLFVKYFNYIIEKFNTFKATVVSFTVYSLVFNLFFISFYFAYKAF